MRCAKWLTNWPLTGCYGRARFHEIWLSDVSRRVITYYNSRLLHKTPMCFANWGSGSANSALVAVICGIPGRWPWRDAWSGMVCRVLWHGGCLGLLVSGINHTSLWMFCWPHWWDWPPRILIHGMDMAALSAGITMWRCLHFMWPVQIEIMFVKHSELK